MNGICIEKTCAICKYANHDPGLGDREDVICTLKPNEPKLVLTNDTCLSHESKYANIKIMYDGGMLMEYDPATESSKEVSKEEYDNDTVEEIPETIETEEEEVSWQL